MFRQSVYETFINILDVFGCKKVCSKIKADIEDIGTAAEPLLYAVELDMGNAKIFFGGSTNSRVKATKVKTPYSSETKTVIKRNKQ